jgi:hypothetical protein
MAQPPHHPGPEQALPPRRRPRCGRCARPAAACVCASLPRAPPALRGAVAVLQHPAEAKRKLATVPLLALALGPRRFALLRGRVVRWGGGAAGAGRAAQRCGRHAPRLTPAPASRVPSRPAACRSWSRC